ncbi:MAG TPA: hypothetical protein VM487_16730, partial [Phycisphaerae bacterium]|nr:hypothetical protein [Phycisphaerae bacterium]
GFTPAELKKYREELYRAIEEGALPDDEPTPTIIRLHPRFQTTTGDKSTVINAARDVNYNPRITRRTVVQLGPQHLSAEQARNIQTRVEEIVQLEAESGRERNYKKWWGKLKTHFRVPTYREIASAQYEDVIAWLQQQVALLRPKLRRTNNPKWRNSLYKGIWARAREVGMSKEEVHAFAGSVLAMDAPPDSLSDLGERNLKKVHDALFRRTRG